MTTERRATCAARRAAADGAVRAGRSRPRRRAGATAALRVLDLAAGRARHVRHRRGRDRSCCRCRAAARSTCDGRDVRAAPAARSVFAGVTDFAYVPRDAAVTVIVRGRRPVRAARRPRDAAAAVPRYGPADDVAGRAARRRARPAARSTTSARPATFEADRLIAVEVLTPGRQLVVLPAAQARRGRARASRVSRRSTTSRSRRPTAGVGYQRVYGLGPGPEIDVLRRGPHRRRRADPARLARPVDGRARLRPLLPQRDGRARRRAGLADLRRPGARLGPRHLGRTRRSTRGCPLTTARRRR